MVFPKLHWGQFPKELLVEIFNYLPAKDLLSCMSVNNFWNYVGREERLWKKLFHNEFFWFYSTPKIYDSFREEFLYFKRDMPRKVIFSVEHQGYSWQVPVFSNNGKFLIVSGKPASFSVYTTDDFELIDERCLNYSLGWLSIDSMYFSPDDSKVLISGTREGDPGEVAVFSVDDATKRVHFLCRVLSFPKTLGSWFDNDHILVGEYYEFCFQSPIASSISQIYLCSLPKHKHDISNFYPFLRFLNQKCMVLNPLVTSTVSSRFRRVVQIGQQAKQEGKTLAEKLQELDLHTDGDSGSTIKELREVLDQEQQCFRCYLKHTLTKEEYGGSTECNCLCHQAYHKMLIYVTGEFRERICFKLLDHELVNDALTLKRFKLPESSPKTDEQPEDRWEYIMSRVDQPDHHIDFGGCVVHIWLSPDQKQLFVILKTVAGDGDIDANGICNEVRVIDLDKMIVDPIGCRGTLKPLGSGHVSCGSRLAVSYAENDINIWSTHHLGLPVSKLHVDLPISSVAVHPSGNYLAVTCGCELRIYDK
ncbi:unnamed protein product [Auanema sp. JU1783]|nr:unnamed protein product [Auanema sp. JU1783]